MRINTKFKVQNIAEENVILLQGEHGVDTTKIISLNPTALWLWNELYHHDFTVDSVKDALVNRYGISSNRAQQDAQNWMGSLMNHNLIEL